MITTNVLMAYPYAAPRIRALRSAHKIGIRVMLDSGAFTAHRTGRQITVAEYAEFLRTLEFVPDGYLNLDVIGSPERSHANYEALRSYGLRPIPVFTYGEKPEALEGMYATSPTVAVGGLVGRAGKRGYLRWVTERVAGRPMHLLGNTSPDVLAALRPSSCDSSNWTAAARYGSFRVYASRGTFVLIARDAFRARPRPDVAALVRGYGIEPRALAHEPAWRGADSVTQRLSIRSWLRYASDVERILGTRLYLAVAQEQALPQIMREVLAARAGEWTFNPYHRSAA